MCFLHSIVHVSWIKCVISLRLLKMICGLLFFLFCFFHLSASYCFFHKYLFFSQFVLDYFYIFCSPNVNCYLAACVSEGGTVVLPWTTACMRLCVKTTCSFISPGHSLGNPQLLRSAYLCSWKNISQKEIIWSTTIVYKTDWHLHSTLNGPTVLHLFNSASLRHPFHLYLMTQSLQPLCFYLLSE